MPYRCDGRLAKAVTGYDRRMARHPLPLSLVAIGLLLPATALAQSAAPPPDVPVAACPAGTAPARLAVAGQARGTWRLGPFAVTLDAGAMSVEAEAGHGLWSSAGDGFVAAGAGDPGILDGGGGFYRIQSRFTDCWRHSRVRRRTRNPHAVTLRGRLTGSRAGTSAGPVR